MMAPLRTKNQILYGQDSGKSLTGKNYQTIVEDIENDFRKDYPDDFLREGAIKQARKIANINSEIISYDQASLLAHHLTRCMKSVCPEYNGKLIGKLQKSSLT